MIVLVYDLLQIVFDKLDFISQLRFRQVDNFVYENLQMTNFYDINQEILDILSDDILLNYPYVRQLNARYNGSITNVNHLSELIKLNATLSNISQTGISKLHNLLELDAKCALSDNNNITNVNHLKKLQKLNIGSVMCRIGQNWINELTELIVLNAEYNRMVKDVNHLKKLKYLNAGSFNFVDCEIDQAGISELYNLIEVNISGNTKIKCLKHCKMLKTIIT